MRKTGLFVCALFFLMLGQHVVVSSALAQEEGWFGGMARKSQNFCYNVMARTFWDPMMSGFQPGRKIAISQLDIQPSDRVLFVGEGSGLDFDVLPTTLDVKNLKALDYSPQMVLKAKQKAV